MRRIIRIGTRDSELALWQANNVKKQLAALGYDTQLVPVKATGDLELDKPLYELGVTGIFTKTLDVAMLVGEIDIAVHSMKDVPTALPKGIIQAAVLKRANPKDLLVHKGLDFLNEEGIIATGSLRRKAQWLHRYPLHEVVDLRGNVNTRLEKLADNDWNAAIFAAAGLERINRVPKHAVELHWMLPAPAQGAMMVTALVDDVYCKQALSTLNDVPSALCTSVEREFLRELEGGCSAPIGALAIIEDALLHFKGTVLSLDGQQKIAIDEHISLDKVSGFGKACAQEVLQRGGKAIMEDLRNTMNS